MLDHIQWPSQEPKLEVPIPYMLGLFFRPKFQGISPQNMARNMVRLRISISGSFLIPIDMAYSGLTQLIKL